MKTLFTLTVSMAAACLLQAPAYAQYKTQIGGSSSSSSTVQRDLNKLTQAAKAGDSNAQFLLGSLYSGYMDDSPVAPNHSLAIKWFTAAANNGHTQAMYILGNLYVIGSICPRDEAKGIRYLRAAARRGHRDAQEVLLKDLRVGW